jgi:predicted Zn-dependent protease
LSIVPPWSTSVALTALPKSPAIRKAAARFDVALHRFAEAAALLAPLERENPSDAETTYYLAVAVSTG